jgi:hypothetical protein
LWLKDVAPTPGLRKWFSHDPAKWKQFVQRYWKELNARPAAVALLRQKIKQGTVTLVYAAHDEEHNGALALKEFLEHRKVSDATARAQGPCGGARRDRHPKRSKPRTQAASNGPVEYPRRRSVHPPQPPQRALDPVEEASIDSFPCSDPPGYGHA